MVVPTAIRIAATAAFIRATGIKKSLIHAIWEILSGNKSGPYFAGVPPKRSLIGALNIKLAAIRTQSDCCRLIHENLN